VIARAEEDNTIVKLTNQTLCPHSSTELYSQIKIGTGTSDTAAFKSDATFFTIADGIVQVSQSKVDPLYDAVLSTYTLLFTLYLLLFLCSICSLNICSRVRSSMQLSAKK
jgi:hypothetical protein